LKGELDLMKKVKILIAVLVCSVMMMGVGYAWWNDSIMVATTANTGNMNMEFAGAGEILDQSGYITSNFEFGTTPVVPETETETGSTCCTGNWQWGWNGHGHGHGPKPPHDSGSHGDDTTTETGTIANNKNLRCTLNNLYPGAWVVLKVVVKNAGTIPVRFKDVKLTGVGGTDIGYLSCELVDDDNSAAIKPNATKAFKVRVSVTDNVKYNNESQNESATFNIQFNWIQWNQDQAAA
jgi:hypothetical protein